MKGLIDKWKEDLQYWLVPGFLCRIEEKLAFFFRVLIKLLAVLTVGGSGSFFAEGFLAGWGFGGKLGCVF